jgi:hypothetical protein
MSFLDGRRLAFTLAADSPLLSGVVVSSLSVLYGVMN